MRTAQNLGTLFVVDHHSFSYWSRAIITLLANAVLAVQAEDAVDFSPFRRTLVDWGSTFIARLPHLISATIVVLVFWLIARASRRGVGAAGRRARLDTTVTSFLSRLTGFLVVFLGLLVAAVVVFPSFQPGDLITGLGITSIAIGFALKDILQNFFAGILLLWIKPFRIGDQIRIREFEGIVDEITIRSTQLRTYDGERVVLPNGDVYVSAILVRAAYGKRRVHLTIGLKASEQLDKVRAAISTVLEHTSGVLSEPKPEIRAESLLAGVLNLGIYFWTEPDQVQSMLASDRVLSGIQDAFQENGVALA